jgi:hypothetical protein
MGRDFCINGDLICGKSFSISRYNGYISDALHRYSSCEEAIKGLLSTTNIDVHDKNDIFEAIFAFAFVFREGYEIGDITYN